MCQPSVLPSAAGATVCAAPTYSPAAPPCRICGTREIGHCPWCHQPVTDDQAPVVWWCPTDLPPDNPHHLPPLPAVLLLREVHGTLSGCGRDYLVPGAATQRPAECHRELPVHDACFDALAAVPRYDDAEHACAPAASPPPTRLRLIVTEQSRIPPNGA